MSTTIWKEWIDKEIGEIKKPNENMELITTAITGSVYPKMKEAISVSEILTLATHMRTKIRLPDDTLVPVNGINFIIASSGASKDKSLNQARKCFSGIYVKMNKYLDDQAVKEAVKEAEAAGKTDEDFMEFYKKPRPLFGGAKPTVSGIQGHLNQLQNAHVGGGHIYSGEFGSELANSNAMLDILQIAAELYDLGNMKADWRKTEEAQGKEIKSMNFSSIFISSPGNIIYDQTVKKKFIVEFTTKLARRSFFNFNKGDVEVLKETVDQLLAREAKELNDSIKAQQQVDAKLQELKPRPHNILQLEDGLWEIYGVVKRYYEELAEEIDPELESYKLSTAHTQWRALKLAGAYAQLDNSQTVTKRHFAEALDYCESTSTDLKEFNEEINKESYELLDDYMASIYKDHKIVLTAHKLSKLGYIENTKSAKLKLTELCDMANDISDGIYTAEGTKIQFEKLVQKDVIGASYRVSVGTKEERAKNCKDGFAYKEVSFDRVANLLSNDTAYCPFEFKDGVRANDNIVGGTKLVILDIDESDVTDGEMHDMLSDYKHHICRTSNQDNPFKFRIALELDSYVTIDSKNWKKFLESISESIGMNVDSLPQSQIYFGYKGRQVLSNIHGDLFQAKEHLLYANKETQPKQVPSRVQAKKLLDNAIDTFWYLYECTSGQRSLTLIRAAKHAKDLGATEEEVKTLMYSAQEYWVEPLEDERFERTIIKQIERIFE